MLPTQRQRRQHIQKTVHKPKRAPPNRFALGFRAHQPLARGKQIQKARPNTGEDGREHKVPPRPRMFDDPR